MTPNQKNATEVFVTGTAQISHGYTTVLRYVLLTHSRIQTLLIYVWKTNKYSNYVQ